MLLQYPVEGDIDWENAIACTRRAHQLNPNDVIALLCLGYTEISNCNPKLGIEYLLRVLRLSPSDPMTYQVHQILAGAHNQLKDYEGALRWASMAERDAPGLPQALLGMALAYVGLGKIDHAKAVIERLRKLGACRAWDRRLQIDRSGPFFTGFLSHSWAMGLQIR